MSFTSISLTSIEWIPFNIPVHRRLETLAVIHFIVVWLIFPIACLWLPFYIFMYTPFWWSIPIYFIWFIYDWETPQKGSRVSLRYRNSIVWKLFADYFPMKLVKTCELDPERNYIVGCHPHGILCIGSFTTLCTNGTNFRSLFPGIRSYLMTLSGQFWIPFRREIGLALGGVESSKKSLEFLLTKNGKGNAVGIVLGGAQEVYDAHPNTNVLKIAKRKGFCKYALKYGADLVPLYNFGENDVYNQYYTERGSDLRDMQMEIVKRFGFVPPIIKGRGIFNYSFGMLPHRKPIYAVMGTPIKVDKIENPSSEEIDDLHRRYISALNTLFHEHKQIFGLEPDACLHIY
uniref:Acyltransferase n=1 Tax=Rhabditophanes sp. KR3021 TaxID=114890 RepID=A0AC35TS39_9BILA